MPGFPYNYDRSEQMLLNRKITRRELNEALADIQQVELAYAENITGTPTVIPVFNAANALVAGTNITVPPHENPVYLEWGAVITVPVAGSALVALDVYDQTAGGAGVIVSTAARGLRDAQVLYSGFYNTILGKKRIAASATEKIYQLRTILYRDSGSSMTASLLNGPTTPTFLAAIQR